MVRSAKAYPNQFISFIRLGLWWFWNGNLRPLLFSLIKTGHIPRFKYLEQIRGSVIGFSRYNKARRKVLEFEKAYGPILPSRAIKQKPSKKTKHKIHEAVAIRFVDISQKLVGLEDVTEYKQVSVYANNGNHSLGCVKITNNYQPISVNRLLEAIVDQFELKLLDPNVTQGDVFMWAKVNAALTDLIMPHKPDELNEFFRIPEDVSVSVVVATFDRPNDLRNCLQDLKEQKTSRTVEIIVVDNNPASGLTAPVVSEFPSVILVNETRKGLAYARNAGFNASWGTIVISTDDDVKLPEDWLEKLIAPFIRPEVMIVTGNVLPFEIENEAQELFETYGGLGRGFERLEVASDWFNSFRKAPVPAWKLGATANAAFRASIFNDPKIGLMDEALGPGMPSGVGEDTYLFYKVLKAGYTLVYEPSAFLWHKHRNSMKALRRQLYNYSKGHVAYHLTTLIRDRDLRALTQLIIHLQVWRVWQIYQYVKALLHRRRRYPLSLILLEIAGNLAGPLGLWMSRKRVKREGHSNPYIPVSQRGEGEK